MIHPFMPFLTEELWQRLPRRPGDRTISIMKAAYPQYRQELDDAASEAVYELILGCSKGIRSLMAEYGIKYGAKGMFLLLSVEGTAIDIFFSPQPSFKQPTMKPIRPSRMNSHRSRHFLGKGILT